MGKLTDEKKIRAIVLLFTATYMVSYMTRINFGAVITEIVAQTGMTKSMLSAAVTGSAITYGIGQVVSGYVGDRLSPKRLILCGLLVSTAMNCLILFCRDHIQMTVTWCINGMAQAFMWPPMVKLMVGLFTEKDYKRATTMVNWGSSFGTIAIYLGAPLAIMVSGWKSLFVFTALTGIAMAILWQRSCPEMPKAPKTEDRARENAEGSVAGRFPVAALGPLLLLVMSGIVLQGALRDGVTTWMPSYISETYQLGSAISILTGVALPVFCIASLRVVLALYEKSAGNPVRCAGAIFAVGAGAALLLTLVSGHSAAGSVFFSALLTGSMYGVNLMLVSMVPPFFQKYGNISTVSGLLNSCTYIGSAISTYGIAVLSENLGWKMTAFSWCLIALAGTVVCAIGAGVWKHKMQSKGEEHERE